MKLQPMPSAPAPTVFPMLVRDFCDGQDLDVVLLVRAAETRRYLDLVEAERALPAVDSVPAPGLALAAAR